MKTADVIVPLELETCHGKTPCAAAGDAEQAVVTFKAESNSDADINRRVLEHGMASHEWRHRELYEQLVSWSHRFNTSFFDGRLPQAAISVDLGRASVLGTYRPSRDGLALRYRINLNERHLKRPFADLLETLLHEMVHEWEEVALGRQRGGRYHTVAFCDRAKELGIPVVRRNGQSLGIVPDGPFAQLLLRHGVPTQTTVLAATPEPPPPVNSRSSIRPWTCGCTRVWAARGVSIRAVCQVCRNEFSPAYAAVRRRGNS
jgi:hypothetical protein